MIFKEKPRRIFMDEDSQPITTEEKLDIVLSPAFYWVKKTTLPLQSLRKVTRLLPSIFEDQLPEGEYSYHAQHYDGSFILFAYNDGKILETLAAKGIKPNQINHVYLAQNEFFDIEMPIAIDEHNVLVSLDGIVIKLPANLTDSSQSLELSNGQNFKERIKLSRYKDTFDSKTLKIFVGLVTMLIVLFGFEWWMYSQKNTVLEKRKKAMFDKYELKLTMIQNRAILQGLDDTYNVQLKLRDAIASILTMHLNKDELLTSLQIDKRKLYVKIDGILPSRQTSFVATLRKAGISARSKLNSKSLYLEIEL
jgi:hypothetical protein